MLDINLAQWAAKAIKAKDGVSDVRIVENNILTIERDSLPSFNVAAISTSFVDQNQFRQIMSLGNIDFLLNISKEGTFDGGIYAFTLGRCGLGGMGDLLRCLSEDSPRNYIDKEASFILRGLQQHSKVERVNRIRRNIYEIQLHSQKLVKVIAINDYDITAESIRNALQSDIKFNVIVKSNPNGRITNEAYAASKASEIPVLKWGQLLGYLKDK
jgi:hypothetical protein